MCQTKVKICGIKNVEAAKVAVKNGADFVGMVFVEQSHRCVSIDNAKQIVKEVVNANTNTKTVGLFDYKNCEKALIAKDQIGFDIVQFCGNFQPVPATKSPYIFQIRVIEKGYDRGHFLKQVEKLTISQQCYVILEGIGDIKTLGGSGKTWNWGLVSDICSRTSVFIAGGLNVENVANVINRFAPWGVDVSSGVETNEEKDLQKIETFIKTVKSAF